MPQPKTRTLSAAAKRRIEQAMQQALALHQGGRVREAELVYRRVLEQQPTHPAANHLLGLVRMQQGNSAAAVDLISRAVELRPQDPQYHCNLGVALNAADQPERAILSFSRAIELKPDYPEAFSNRGMALKALRRSAEAVENYRKAIELKPGEAGFYLNMGNAQTDLGDLHEAEASYRMALKLRPDYPAALSGLALTLENLGRADEAIAAGEVARTRRPNEAEFHRSLARAYRAAGRLEEAAASYRRALAIRPDYAEVHRLLAEMVFHTSRDADVAAMESLYSTSAPGSEERMALSYGLGKAFDDLGDYPRSIDYFLEANSIKRRMGSFSLAQTSRDMRAIERLFSEAPPERLLSGGYREEAPVFIVGLPRSGKTSLEAMLARHPKVYGAGELRVLAKLASDLVIRHGLSADDASLAKVPVEAFAELGAEYSRYIRVLSSAPVIVDTMPQNFRIIGFIRLALPNARIIHCVRSKPEHCIALFHKHFGRPGYEYTCDWDELAGFYALYKANLEVWRRAFPGFVRDVDYARVQADPIEEMREILDFCGLDWHDACAEPQVSEPQLGQESRPVDTAEMRLRAYRPLLAALSG